MDKILHVVGGMYKAGTETMLMNIYRKIDRNKVQFDFLYFTDEDTYYDDEILNLGGKIIRANSIKSTGIFNSIKEVKDIILNNGPYKAIHAHTLFNCGIVMAAAKKAGVDIRISHAHTTADDESSLIRKIYVYIMRTLILHNSTVLLSCSDLAAKYLYGDGILSSKKHISFPNLIDYESILNTKIEDINNFKLENSIKEDEIVIGHIGSLKKIKNQQYILHIVKYMKDNGIKVKLFLVGGGENKQELEQLAYSLDINNQVILTGVRDDINVILKCFDIFVFPSIFEGLGLVLLEAQSAGLPCIVSEAIQPEADLGLGLFTKLNLSDGVEIWAKNITENFKYKETDKKKIIDAIDKNGYSVEKCISKLLAIYEIDK